MQWLSIKEASQLVSKSPSTIKRLLSKHGIDFDNLTSKQDSAGYLVYKKEPASYGFRWFITEDSLLNFFNNKSSNNSNNNLKDTNQASNNDILLDALKSQIMSLENQVNLLQRELEQKNNQIAELHLLLKHSQVKQLQHEPNQPQGVFSKILIRFGL